MPFTAPFDQFRVCVCVDPFSGVSLDPCVESATTTQWSRGSSVRKGMIDDQRSLLGIFLKLEMYLSTIFLLNISDDSDELNIPSSCLKFCEITHITQI